MVLLSALKNRERAHRCTTTPPADVICCQIEQNGEAGGTPVLAIRHFLHINYHFPGHLLFLLF